MNDVVKIALGVAGGLILAGIIWLAIASYIAHVEVERINKIAQSTLTQMQQNSAQYQRRAEAEAQRQREQQEQIAYEKKKAEYDKQAAIDLAAFEKRAAADLKNQKEAAWKNYFKKSPECENPPTVSAMGECANITIRAKRKFEDIWISTHANGNN